MRIRLSTLPGPSNRHSSTDSEDSENSEKLTPRPSQVAPLGNGNPADWCALSRCDAGVTCARVPVCRALPRVVVSWGDHPVEPAWWRRGRRMAVGSLPKGLL